jgi:DNA-binding Lrp family transcriptional regulator
MTQRRGPIERDLHWKGRFHQRIRSSAQSGLSRCAIASIVGIRVDRATPNVLRGFCAVIGKFEEVVECHRVAGADYVVKIRVPDM